MIFDVFQMKPNKLYDLFLPFIVWSLECPDWIFASRSRQRICLSYDDNCPEIYYSVSLVESNQSPNTGTKQTFPPLLSRFKWSPYSTISFSPPGGWILRANYIKIFRSSSQCHSVKLSQCHNLFPRCENQSDNIFFQNGMESCAGQQSCPDILYVYYHFYILPYQHNMNMNAYIFS